MYETLKSAFEHRSVTEYDRWGLRNASKNEEKVLKKPLNK